MTVSFPMPVVLNDVQLQQVAQPARLRLFPLLNRAGAFTPLVLVCCVLPLFQLLLQPALDEEASLWGLRSLAVAHATTRAELLEPGLNEQGQPLIFQPPLAAWLNGLVLRALGPAHPLSSSLVSLIATAVGIGLTVRLAWKTGGPNTALIAAVLMSTHPQILEWSIVPTQEALGCCLLVVAVSEFQKHCKGSLAAVSPNLVFSGVAWGLSILAIGPVSLLIPLVFMTFAVISGWRNPVPPVSAEDRLPPSLFRSALYLTGIGIAIGAWWEVMMSLEYGAAFWQSWLSSLPVVCHTQGTEQWQCDILPLLQPNWLDWLNQQLLLLGWLLLGLIRCTNEWRRPASDRSRRRCQFLVLWWIFAFCGRSLNELAGTAINLNSAVWNVALMPPTILMATLGMGDLIERGTSWRTECFLVVFLAAVIVRWLTSSWMIGLGGAGVALAVLGLAPLVIPTTWRSGHCWCEARWRRLLQIAVYGSLLACILFGFCERLLQPDDASRLMELRDRVTKLPTVRRITLMVTRDPVPVSVVYLLRCRWPNVEIVTSDGWDSGLTRALQEEAQSPRSRFLILEWTRRDIRLTADTSQAWNVSAVGTPMRYLGRRLSLVMIEPRDG